MVARILLMLLALIVVLMQSGAAAQEKEPASPANQVELKKGDHILFYGDSLTDGSRGPKGWVTMVRDTLKEKHPGLGVEVSVVAVGGYCIVDRVKRVDNEVLAKKPTIVVIQGGVPDALRYKRDQFKAGLEELIDILQKANVRVVVCSCTSLGEKHDGSNRIDPALDDFAEIARQVAKDKRLPLNDLRTVFKEHWKKNNPDNKPSGILTYDGNHFNDAGNKFVAVHMLKMFKASAKETSTPKSGALAPDRESAAGPAGLSADNFAQLRQQIRPQPGESRWLEIPWLIDIHEARQRAAALGKPLFVYSGGGATGIGAC